MRQVMLPMDSNNEYFHLVVVSDHDPNDWDDTVNDNSVNRQRSIMDLLNRTSTFLKSAG